MKTNERLLLMTEIASRHPNIGKTAMMKITYLMQTLRDVPFGYHFEIYTYGPYCQTVMSDIEYAESMNYINVVPINYGGGMTGYQICATDEGHSALFASPIHNVYSAQMEEILTFFGNMKAKDLELYSTIVFVAFSCQKNGWDSSPENVCEAVSSIKPHFTKDAIHDAYLGLEARGFLPF